MVVLRKVVHIKTFLSSFICTFKLKVHGREYAVAFTVLSFFFIGQHSFNWSFSRCTFVCTDHVISH